MQATLTAMNTPIISDPSRTPDSTLGPASTTVTTVTDLPAVTALVPDADPADAFLRLLGLAPVRPAVAPLELAREDEDELEDDEFFDDEDEEGDDLEEDDDDEDFLDDDEEEDFFDDDEDGEEEDEEEDVR